MLVALYCMDYSSTLNMEAIFSSETFVDFHRTMPRYIPEDRPFQNHWCDNLKSYTFIYFSIAQQFLP